MYSKKISFQLAIFIFLLVCFSISGQEGDNLDATVAPQGGVNTAQQPAIKSPVNPPNQVAPQGGVNTTQQRYGDVNTVNRQSSRFSRPDPVTQPTAAAYTSINSATFITERPSDIKLDKNSPSFFSDGYVTYARPTTKIKLSSSDSISAPSNMEYKVDEGSYLSYKGPFVVPTEGIHQVFYRSYDIVGNLEFANVISVIVDVTGPSLSLSTNVPFMVINKKIFVPVKKPPLLHIKAFDQYSGVLRIEYSLNGGEFQEYKEPLPLEGGYVIEYRGIDNIGNVSSTKKIVVSSDAIPPSPKIGFSNNLIKSNDNEYATKTTKVVVNAQDNAGGSGVAAIYIKHDSGEPFQPYTEPVLLGREGVHNIEVKAVDRVGNESAIVSRKVIVDPFPPRTNLEFISDVKAIPSTNSSPKDAGKSESVSDNSDNN